MATPARPMEKWDDDGDLDFRPFHGGLNLSTNTNTASISSRLSSQAESVAGDDDWNLVVNDDHSTAQAIQSAQQAGIPLPKNVPASALLGGAIKRLGKKMSRQKVNDDWDNDLEMPDGVALRLKARPAQPSTRGDGEEYDEFDDLEGSLGIRFAGKRDPRNRSCSASAMSPSLGSVTAESETDELRGIELPEGPMDFEAILKKRRATDAELSDLSQASPALDQPATINVHKKSKLLSDDVNEDYLKDFDLAGQDMLGKRTMNRNIKVKSAKIVLPASSRVATTLNFHDKPTEKPTHTRSHIPRPVSGARPTSTRLEPVFESGAASSSRERRGPMTTSAQLLRSKRSMPALRSHHSPGSFNRPAVPSFNSPQPPPHKPLPHHVRRDSDPHRRRPQSPPVRPTSRLSNGVGGTSTPSRMQAPRTDLAPASLAREAAAKKTITRPARRRNYGDGNELEVFDDLPTSSIKESRFVKQPIGRGPPKAVSRPTQNRFETRDLPKRQFAVPDRMQTPGPRTPASPTKGFHDVVSYTPSYLRDTAASRIARESRLNLNQPRPKSEGPLMPLSTNWKAQVAARSPHSSPSAQRLRGPPKRPHLIKAMGEMATQPQKGMVYNPQTFRWEGNENAVSHFEMPPPLGTPTPSRYRQMSFMERTHAASASPPRPALIAPMSNAGTQGVQVNSGMVFDPRQMKWLKLRGGRDASGPLSPSVTDGEEEDAFAGIEDLKDESTPMLLGAGASGMASPVSMATAPGVGDVHEEFDLGPKFIQTQEAEESVWRRRCEKWFPRGEARADGNAWKWAIREIARVNPAEHSDQMIM